MVAKEDEARDASYVPEEDSREIVPFTTKKSLASSMQLWQPFWRHLWL